MFGWLGGILGLVNSNPTASELAGDISSGVDKMFYTSEEKAEASAKAFEGWLRMVEMMKGSEQYRSITRRILAVGIVFNLLLMIWICITSEICATFGWLGLTVSKEGFTPITLAIIRVGTVYQLGWVFCTIIVFYFGPHLIQFFSKSK
jgi:hypothetical protein